MIGVLHGCHTVIQVCLPVGCIKGRDQRPIGRRTICLRLLRERYECEYNIKGRSQLA